MIVCLSMILFNVVYLFIYERTEGTGRKQDAFFKKYVKRQIEDYINGVSPTKRDIKKLSRKCENMWKLAAWDEQVDVFAVEHSDIIENYVKSLTDVFLSLTSTSIGDKPIQQAHFAYVIQKYDIHKFENCRPIVVLMLELVKSRNLHCRENALKVIYEYGDVDIAYQAIVNISEGDFFHHEKLLVEGLLTFSGDKYELMNRLIQNRKQFKPFMQRVILNYVRFGSSQYSGLYLNIMRDESEYEEYRYIAIRYFGQYVDEQAYETLIDFDQNSDDDDWEFAAIAATALAAYPKERTLEVLKGCLTNRNWYVRYNAATSLDKFNLPDAVFEDIINGNDQYAKEVLQYRFQLSDYIRESNEGA